MAGRARGDRRRHEEAGRARRSQEEPGVPASLLTPPGLPLGFFLGFSWASPGLLLGFSWASPWLLLGSSWAPPDSFWLLLGLPGLFLASPGFSCAPPGCVGLLLAPPGSVLGLLLGAPWASSWAPPEFLLGSFWVLLGSMMSQEEPRGVGRTWLSWLLLAAPGSSWLLLSFSGPPLALPGLPWSPRRSQEESGGLF